MNAFSIVKIVVLAGALGQVAFICAQPLPADVASCLDSAWVTEPYSLQASEECRRTLIQYVNANWRSVAMDWDRIAPDHKKKWVLLNVAEELDSGPYMQFLEDVRDLRRGEKISDQMFETAALMPGHRKEAFLALNYQHPRVRDYIASIRPLVGPDLQSFLDQVLSGWRKEVWVERYQKQKVPVEPLLLPNTQVAQVRSPAPIMSPVLSGTASADRQSHNVMSAVDKRKRFWWPWAVGILLLAGLAALFWKRRG